MSGVKHTPGPWFIVSHPDGWSVQDRVGGAGRCVARDYGDTSTANARLIAAAPDLLDALEWYVDNDDVNEGDPENEFWTDGLNRARTAIARAKGESE